jgi:hypothetical protein
MSDFESAFDGKLTLFNAKTKKSEKAPDRTGTLELELSEAMRLAEYLTAHPGEEGYGGKVVIKIPVSAWNQVSTTGVEYISGKIWAKKPDNNVAPPF